MPLAENLLFQLVQQQLTTHSGHPVLLRKAGRYIAAVSITSPASIMVKTKYSTEHRPDHLRQYLSHVGWYTISEADLANGAPPFLTFVQGTDQREFRYLVVPQQQLRQLTASKDQDFHLHIDFASAGHVFDSRGLPGAEREHCARSRDYLTRHHPTRDLTAYLNGWQSLAS